MTQDRMLRGPWFISIVLALAAVIAFPSWACAEGRVALVIGNSSYQNVARLPNTSKDARLMAQTLKALGFSLVGNDAQLDLTKAAADRAIQSFGQEMQGADVALFYYAGHGLQVAGSNYLVPIEANPVREADVDFQLTDANVILRQMQGAKTKLNMVILDACRNNPLSGRGLRSISSGLVQMQAPEGTLISYATQPGNVASDGVGENSPYTRALTQAMNRPGLDLFRTFNAVGLAVKRDTGGVQQPWVSSSPIDGDFYFSGSDPVAASRPAAGPDPVKVARLPEPGDPLRRDLVTECDRLAGSPVDRDRTLGATGIEARLIDVVPALAACDSAMRQYPTVGRFVFQTGRVAAHQKDFRRARDLFQKSMGMGHIASINNLANLYRDGAGGPQDLPAAKRLYEKAVASDEPVGMFNLALLYQNGMGVQQDDQEARRLYERAAAAGLSTAMVNLGRLYYAGRGVTQDYAEARRWFDRAVAAGSVLAMTNIGNMYRDARGVSQDYAEARRWYDRAVAAGDPSAMTAIGYLYREGKGVAQDYALARQWYEKAAALENGNAMAGLGQLYRDGYGVAKDLTMARNWFQKSADVGDVYGMNNLGLLYLQGAGVPKDFAEAKRWFEKTASSGGDVGMSNLGYLYQNGLGVPKDLTQARAWYEKAAKMGNSYSANALTKLK